MIQVMHQVMALSYGKVMAQSRDTQSGQKVMTQIYGIEL